jgi:TldD protein
MQFTYGIDKLKSKLKDVDFYRIMLEENYSENIIAKEGKIDSIAQNNNFGLSIFYTLGKFGYFYSTNDPKDLDKFKIDFAFKKYSNLDYKPTESGIKDKKIIGKESNLDLENIAKELSKVTKLKNGINSHFADYDYSKQTRMIICENTEIEKISNYGFSRNELVVKKGNTLRFEKNRTGKASALNKEFFDFQSKNESFEKTAFKKLDYKEGLSGTFDVILDPHLSGVLAHEAIGHGCESDLVYNKQSILRNKLGTKLAPSFVNLFDNPDPTKENRFGGLYYDDEGYPAQNKQLIKNGKLNEYITNTRFSQLMKIKNNGGARAETFNHNAIPRMTNTYFEPGNKTLNELIEEMKNGVLLCNGYGGEVDPTLGTYQFGVKDANIIKNGKLNEPRVNLSFSGNILDSLKNIVDLSKAEKERSPGFCSKAGQEVYVTCFGPYILIKNVRLG